MLLGIIAFSPLFYFSYLDQNEKEYIQNLTSIADQKNAILSRIKSRVPVPEPPKMLTVVNKSAMKDLPFYEILQKGDKIFIFPKAKIGVIYNPKIDTVTAIVDISSPKFSPYEKMAY